MTTARKQNLNRLQKGPGKWHLYYVFHTLESKERAQGNPVQFIGDRLGRQEKAQWGGGGGTSGIGGKVNWISWIDTSFTQVVTV